MTTDTDIRDAFAQHLDIIAGELYKMGVLFDTHDLPGDFLGDLYPFRQELDELQAEVANSAEALTAPVCGDYPAPCNHDDAGHTVRLGSHGMPV